VVRGRLRVVPVWFQAVVQKEFGVGELQVGLPEGKHYQEVQQGTKTSE
jgi:hypothetical protein